MCYLWPRPLDPVAAALRWRAGTWPRRPRRRFALDLELLEPRCVPAVYNVTGTADVLGQPTLNPDGTFNAPSLRAAVLAANATPGVADVINLPAGTYQLTRVAAGDEPEANGGDLDVTDDLVIQDVGPGPAVIDASPLTQEGHPDRVFTIHNSGQQPTAVTLSGLTITGGNAVPGDAPGQANNPNTFGGAIYNQGDLTVQDSVVSNSLAHGRDGGLAGAAFGGGIFNLGTLTVLNSTLSGNTASGGDGAADAPGGGAFGGALASQGGSVTLQGTVQQNFALGGAGGQAQRAFGGSGGTAQGGGIFFSGGDLTVSSGTSINFNQALGGQGGAGTAPAPTGAPGGPGGFGGTAQGGGIFFSGNALSVGGTFLGSNRAVGGDGGAGASNPFGSAPGGVGGEADGGGLAAVLGTVSLQGSGVEGNIAQAGQSDSTSNKNLALRATGGGVYSLAGTLTVTNSSIDNNQATGPTTGPGPLTFLGGGVYNLGSATFTAADVSDNSANRGGGIYNDSNSDGMTGSIDLAGSNLQENDAAAFGGLAGAGGAIYNNGGTVNVTDRTLDDGTTVASALNFNIAEGNGNPSGTAGRGGAIFNARGTVTLSGGTTLQSNEADGGFTGGGQGGAIFNGSGSVTLTDSTVSGNNALQDTQLTGGGQGGGIFNLLGAVTLNSSTVSGNVAHAEGDATGQNAKLSAQGGGIYNLGGPLTLNGSTVSGNTARNGQGATAGGGQGGGIYNVPSGTGAAATATLNNSTVSGNTADEGGGLYNLGTATLTSSTFDGNTAGTGGGVASFGGSAALTGSTVSNNSADFGGGLFIENGPATLDNSTVNGNTANVDGGGIYDTVTANNTSTLTLTNSTVTNNAAAQGVGGGIANFFGTAALTGSTVSNNTAAQGGGIFNENNSTLSLANNSTVSGNTATGGRQNGGQGGGIDNAGAATLTDTTVSGNSATGVAGSGQGGGIFTGEGGGIFNTGTLTLLRSTLSNNTAAGSGTGDYGGAAGAGFGGGLATLLGSVTLQNSTVQGNEALGGGGAPAFFGSPGGAGGAARGGGVFVGGGDLTVSGGTLISSNQAVGGQGGNAVSDSFGGTGGAGGTAQGGGIFFSGSTLSVTDSTLSGNTAQGGTGGTSGFGPNGTPLPGGPGGEADGGGLATVLGTVSLQSTTLDGNKAIGGRAGGRPQGNFSSTDGPARGGGLYSTTGVLAVSGGTVANNSAQSAGFGFALFGGGVYNAGNATFTGTAAHDNKAIQGGGLFNDPNGTLTLTDSTVSTNSAEQGAGIDNAGAATLSGSTVSDNSATGDGGGVSNSGTLTVTNSSLSGNKAAEGSGGGLANFSGAVTLNGSTVSGNSAAGDGGGGIFNQGTAALTNSTVSGNSDDFVGGGIANAGQLDLLNVTVANNSAGGGGGLFNSAQDQPTTLANSLFANNAGGNFQGTPAPTSRGHNLDSDGTLGLNGAGDLSGAPGQPLDPKLGSLQNNGGPTSTLALGAGSVAIDAGDDSLAPPTDQRGVSRPQGLHSDIGAFELQGSAPKALSVTPSVPVVNDTTVGAGRFTLTVVFDSPMNQSVSPTLTFTAADPSQTLKFASGRWASPTAYVATYDVRDANIVVPPVDVLVAGGRAASGFDQQPASFPGVFRIDTTNPRPLSVTPSVPIITDATVGAATFTLTVVFDGPMSPQVNPILTFPAADATQTLSFASGRWTDRTTYVATYDVRDANVLVPNVAVDVTGGSGANGNRQVAGDFRDVFAIDTTNARVLAVTPSAPLITDATAGTATFTLTVVFDGPMNPDVNPTLSFPAADPSQTLTFASGRWTNATTYVATYDVRDANVAVPAVAVDVTGGSGANGNRQVAGDFRGVFAIDTTNPKPLSVTASVSDVTDATVGATTFMLKVVFDAPMDTTVNPTLALPDGAARTLTLASGHWDNATTFVATYDVTASGVVLPAVDVGVASGKGANGNPEAAGPFSDVFAIDTLSPQVLAVRASAAVVTNALVGAHAFTLTITFSEGMDTTAKPALTFPGVDTSAALRLAFGRWLDDHTYALSYDVIDPDVVVPAVPVAVTGGHDTDGNPLSPGNFADVFGIDIHEQTPVLGPVPGPPAPTPIPGPPPAPPAPPATPAAPGTPPELVTAVNALRPPVPTGSAAGFPAPEEGTTVPLSLATVLATSRIQTAQSGGGDDGGGQGLGTASEVAFSIEYAPPERDAADGSPAGLTTTGLPDSQVADDVRGGRTAGGADPAGESLDKVAAQSFLLSSSLSQADDNALNFERLSRRPPPASAAAPGSAHEVLASGPQRGQEEVAEAAPAVPPPPPGPPAAAAAAGAAGSEAPRPGLLWRLVGAGAALTGAAALGGWWYARRRVGRNSEWQLPVPGGK